MCFIVAGCYHKLLEVRGRGSKVHKEGLHEAFEFEVALLFTQDYYLIN